MSSGKYTEITYLPDFQRGWVWDDNLIRSIIARISHSINKKIQLISLTKEKFKKSVRWVFEVVNTWGEEDGKKEGKQILPEANMLIDIDNICD